MEGIGRSPRSRRSVVTAKALFQFLFCMRDSFSSPSIPNLVHLPRYNVPDKIGLASQTCSKEIDPHSVRRKKPSLSSGMRCLPHRRFARCYIAHKYSLPSHSAKLKLLLLHNHQLWASAVSLGC